MAEKDSFYDILGVPADATQEKIKKAYHEAARTHHPDKRQQQNHDKDGNDDPFLQLQLAYETLRDPDRRHAYDTQQQNYREKVAIPVQDYEKEIALDEEETEVVLYTWQCRCGEVIEYIQGDPTIMTCPGCSILYDASSVK